MRRYRARRESTSISLFPFLAVLICTMGALIVLLVIVVKQADLSAQTRREANEEAVLAEIQSLEDAVAEAEFRTGTLGAHRPELVDQMREATLLRSHYEQQMRELAEQWSQLQAHAQALTEEPTESAPNQAEKIAQLQQQLEATRAAVEQARRDRAAAQPQYALVAYDGRNGTHRRPIFIECTPDGIDLQPFDIHLNLSDFTDPILPGNPLDASILAIRDTWLRQDPRGANGAPYPLILIRPNGSNAYAVVREALKSWDSEFGHQIIPQDMQLTYPENDPRLKDELLAIIENSKQRQARMIAALGVARGGEGGGSGASFSGSSGGGSEGSFNSGAPGSTSASFASSSTESGSAQPDFSLRASGRRGGFVDSGSGRGGNSSFDVARSGPSSTRADENAGPSNPMARTGSSSAGQAVSGQAGAVPDPSQARPLSESRGGDWALPVRSPGSVAYHRPIRMRCLNDRLQILSEDQPNTVIAEFPFQPDVVSSVDPLVDRLWKEIDSWGVAGYQAYWKPELRMEVAPEARYQYEVLSRLLDGSGLSVKETMP